MGEFDTYLSTYPIELNHATNLLIRAVKVD
jgi:hypothetical protein